MKTQINRDGICPFPPSMNEQFIDANGTSIFARTGGSGPAIVLLHGFGDTGDMWGELAETFMADHTVIVPDLRGMGRSAKPSDGYDKKRNHSI